MERMGSKIIELHKLNKNSKTKPFLTTLLMISNVANVLVSLVKTEREIDFLEYFDQNYFARIGESNYWRYNQNRLLYPKWNQSKTRTKVIDIIKEYGEYIPLTKGKIISASQLLERFLFDPKNSTTLLKN